MNPALAFVFRRRSVRRFLPQAVSEAAISDLLAAAMAAPSACNRRPWAFMVLTDPERLATVAALLPNGGFLATAPLGIVVLGDLDRAHAGELSYLLQDCSAAIQNLLLAAPALGLGACWLGVHPRPDRMAGLRALFALPETIVPVSVIALGVPAENPPPRTQFEPDRVHRNHW
jgi:nitroreductase